MRWAVSTLNHDVPADREAFLRIVVIGLSGAGKSTLAKQLAASLGASHIELDALFWESGWTQAMPEAFAARVAAASTGPSWVADGDYSAVRPILWSRATHLVWLDYERPLIMARVIRRSLSRALSGRELWNGNRERWRSWLSRDHPILWAWHQWRPRRKSLEAVLERGEYPHLTVLRARHPRELDGVIAKLK
jgi:adenylate kinase family enzyme